MYKYMQYSLPLRFAATFIYPLDEEKAKVSVIFSAFPCTSGTFTVLTREGVWKEIFSGPQVVLFCDKHHGPSPPPLTHTSNTLIYSVICMWMCWWIHWSDFITNLMVLDQAGITTIEAMLMKSQLRWAGHVSRMEHHRLPKITMFCELSSGHRNRRAPKKRFKDTSNKSLSTGHISHMQKTGTPGGTP